VSFVFNEGETTFLSSTLSRLLNVGQNDQVPTQHRRWNKETIRACWCSTTASRVVALPKSSSGMAEQEEAETSTYARNAKARYRPKPVVSRTF
jgi:hypothetical protein